MPTLRAGAKRATSSSQSPMGKRLENNVHLGNQNETIPQALDREDIFYSAQHEPNENVDAANMGIETCH